MSTALLLLVATAWLVLPGRVMLAACGARVPMPLVTGIPVTFLMLLALSAVFELLNVAWGPISVSLGALVMVGFAFTVGRLVSLRRERPARTEAFADAQASQSGHELGRGPGGVAVAGILYGGTLLGGAAVVVPALQGMRTLDTLNASYDGFFHYAALAFVREQGVAFPGTALTPMYAGVPTYYPTSWHMAASLVPADVVTAANTVALLTVALLPGASISLLHTLLPGRPASSARALVAASCGVAASVFLSLPVMALVFGLWPQALGTALLPMGVAAVAAVFPPSNGVKRLVDSRAVIGAALVMAGTVSVHPGTAVSVGVIVIITVLTVGAALVTRRVVSEPLRSRRLGVVLVVIGLLLAGVGTVLALQVLAPMSRLTAQEGGSTLSTFLVTVFDRPRVRSIPLEPLPVLVLSLLAVVGAAFVLARREVRGAIAILTGLSALVLTFATQSDVETFRALSSPWYGARERIHLLYELAVLVLAATGVWAVLRIAHDRIPRAGRVLTGVAVVILLLPSAVAVTSADRVVLAAALGHGVDDRHLTAYVPPRERAFIERSARELPGDAIVIGDPRDGVTMYWVLGGVEVVYPHLDGLPDTDARRLGRSIDDYAVAPTVCESYRALGEPEYFYQDESEANGDFFRSEEENELWGGMRGLADDSAVVTEIDRDGPYVLYRLDLPCP